jgi:hypothetical protein
MKNKKNAHPPILRHILNLWTLMGHPSAKREWSLEHKIAEIAAAGFDGFTHGLTPAHARLAHKHGLMVVGYFSSANSAEFRKLIQQNVDAGAVHINVQLADHDTPVAESIKLAVKLMKESEKLGAKCAVEVHRDTCTETPEKAYAIAAGYKAVTGCLLPMTWDFSHVSVVKHLNPPYWERLLVDAKLIQQAQQFHFRPFNGHHCQIPVTDGKGRLTVELEQWLPMLEKTIETWLAGKQDGREMFAVPELGPLVSGAVGYRLTCFPPSWDDAKILRGIIDKTWRKAVAKRG